MVPLTHVLALAALLFGLGLAGLLVQRNAIRLLMAVELMLNAVNLNFVAFSRYVTPDDPRGQVFAIFVITVAAAEVAVGLGVILLIARGREDIDVNNIRLLKG